MGNGTGALLGLDVEADPERSEAQAEADCKSADTCTCRLVEWRVFILSIEAD